MKEEDDKKRELSNVNNGQFLIIRKNLFQSIKFYIPEPTRSLIWLIDKDPSNYKSPMTMRIEIEIIPTGFEPKLAKNNFFSEPSLIWTKMAVEQNNELEKEKMYYPEYNRFSPKQRYQYLKWLEDIEKETNLSYVFHYYYGLERHLLIGDYDKAVVEVLRLIKFHDEGSFKYYATSALICSSLYRKRYDILQKAPIILEQNTEESWVLRYISRKPITSLDLINIASNVGFNNKTYIKKYPKLFFKILQENIDNFEEHKGKIFDQFKYKDLKKEKQLSFANLSVPESIRNTKVPNVLGNNTFKAIVLQLLRDAHSKIKYSKTGRKTEWKIPEKAEKRRESIYKEGIISRERLPFPYVLYPGAYGAFIAFQKLKNSTPFFCECSKKAVNNYLTFLLKNKKIEMAQINFPKKIKISVFTNHKQFKYKKGLCHICNQVIPKYRYCHEMYGSKFKQDFGWYIKQEHYKLGVATLTERAISQWDIINKKDCPEDLAEMIVSAYERYNDEMIKRRKQGNMYPGTFIDIFEKQFRQIENIIENRVREHLGIKKIGEEWTSETALYYLMKEILPNSEIIHHYWPKFLEGLELDIYIKDLKIGIEYQGIQHFKPIGFWGGKKGLDGTRKRDKIKKILSKKNNISLVYFYYNEDLTKSLVYNKLKKFLAKK